MASPQTRSERRRILVRYLLFQVPSWCAAGVVLVLVQHFGWIASPWPALLFAGLVLKDLVLYPWMRIAYEPSYLHGPEALQDAVGVVASALEPEGRVRIGAELWRARCASNGCRAAVGERVRILAVDGLTLVVEPVGH